MNNISKSAVTACFASAALMTACTHTIKIEPSDKPILINLNINITQDVRVRLDKSVDDLLSKNEDIF